jgi:putative DNA primase/helicase
MTACETALELLLFYRLWPVAIKPGEKAPIGKSWGSTRPTERSIREMFKRFAKAGVGLMLGPEAGIVDIECDGPEGETSLAKLLGGEIVITLGWSSARGPHQVFRYDSRLARYGKSIIKLPELPGLEIRIGGDGKQLQSNCPPTIGDDDRPREWNATRVVADLPEAVFRFLDAALAAELKPAEGRAKPETDGRANRNQSLGCPDAESRAIAYLDRCEPAISGQNGHSSCFKAACKVGPGFDLDSETAFQLLRDHYSPRCQPPWSEKELRHKIDDAYKKEPRRGWLLDAASKDGARRSSRLPRADLPKEGPPSEEAAFEHEKLTDLGNAKRLVRQHGQDIRYVSSWKKWLNWDGRRWTIDCASVSVMRRAKDTARGIYLEAASLTDKTDRSEAARWATQSESVARLEAMVKLASSETAIEVLPEDLDGDPWLLNCPNGTVDLRTGKLRPHRREDLITKLCPVEFDASAECPVWKAALDLVFDGNPNLIGYWQRLCGMILTGVVREQVLPILHGTGENGKSTLLNCLMGMIGSDYAMKAPPRFLMARRGEAHPTELADLFGKRLVVAIETGEEGRINETLVKELTGSDPIRTRRMREDFWQFNPTHKLLLCTNHKPVIKGTDHAIWRRIHLIPFTVRIPADLKDKRMPEKTARDWPGILAWCVQGCLAWQRSEGGLEPPSEVQEATKNYRQDEDVLARFLDESCYVNLDAPQLRVKAIDLFRTYCLWAEGSKEYPITQKRFGEAMTERGFKRFTSNGTWYEGIGLRQKENSL